MKVLIAGIPEKTANYQKALALCQVPFDVSLYPECLSSYSKLLLPGGGDIEPCRFGQDGRSLENVDPELDRAQFFLLDAFVQAGRPTLGICRGLQVINVYFGGDLIQDLPKGSMHRQDADGHDRIHQVRCAPGSALGKLYNESCLVNSAHHQGCGRIGHGLIVTQAASDRTVEALEHSTRPILGVQWHPERMGLIRGRPNLADGQRLIHYFSKWL